MATPAKGSWPDILGKIEDPRIRNWFTIAKDYGSSRDSWIAIKADSPQHRAWLSYFDRLGWVPVTLRQIELTQHKSWTAPCEWPDSLPMAQIREAAE